MFCQWACFLETHRQRGKTPPREIRTSNRRCGAAMVMVGKIFHCIDFTKMLDVRLLWTWSTSQLFVTPRNKPFMGEEWIDRVNCMVKSYYVVWPSSFGAKYKHSSWLLWIKLVKKRWRIFNCLHSSDMILMLSEVNTCRDKASWPSLRPEPSHHLIWSITPIVQCIIAFVYPVIWLELKSNNLFGW